MQFDLAITNGTVATASDIVRCDVGIRDGKVAALGSGFTGRETIDASGKLVMPGGIDSHVHIDEPPFYGVRSVDDFHAGTVSAACGGNTTIVPFAQQVEGENLRKSINDYHPNKDRTAE